MTAPHHQQIEALPDLFTSSGGAGDVDAFSSLLGASSSSSSQTAAGGGSSMPSSFSIDQGGHQQQHHHSYEMAAPQQHQLRHPHHAEASPAQDEQPRLHRVAPSHPTQVATATADSDAGEHEVADASALFGGTTSSSSSFFDQLASSSSSPSSSASFLSSATSAHHPSSSSSSSSSFSASIFVPASASSAGTPSIPPSTPYGNGGWEGPGTSAQQHRHAAPATTPTPAPAPDIPSGASSAPQGGVPPSGTTARVWPDAEGEELPSGIFAASGDSFFDSFGAPPAGAASSAAESVDSSYPTWSTAPPVGALPAGDASSAAAESVDSSYTAWPAAPPASAAATSSYSAATSAAAPSGLQHSGPTPQVSSETFDWHRQQTTGGPSSAHAPASSVAAGQHPEAATYWSINPGAGGQTTVFTPQAPGSQGRTTSAYPASTPVTAHHQPPATAPIPYLRQAGHEVGPSPPGSAGVVAFNLSAPTGLGASSSGTRYAQPRQGLNPTPTPPGSGSVSMFVPRTSSTPVSMSSTPNTTAAGPPHASTSDYVPHFGGATPKTNAHDRSSLMHTAPMTSPSGFQAHPGQYYPHSPNSQHHRNRSASLQTHNQLQFGEFPRVASNPEFQHYSLVSPPGSNATATLHNKPSSGPNMQPHYGNHSPYGYPQDNSGQMNGMGMNHPAGWREMPEAPGSMYMQLPQNSQDRLLFDRPHAIATFGFGGKLFTLIPQRKRLLNIYAQGPQKDSQSDECTQGPLKTRLLSELLSKNSFMNAFTNFPGPLRNASKDSVIKYITRKASGEAESEDAMADPEATQLLWSLLKVMCAHYGDLSQPDAVKEIRQLLLDGINPSDYTASSPTAQPPLTGPALESATKQMEHLLLSGEREKACQVAMDAGMWAHALFLASHLSPQLYQTACKRFAQTSLAEGSPLQTLYLLLAKCPQELLRSLLGGLGSSTLVDRWRENLAVILANRVQGDVKVIGQLGDILWSTQMRVAAAHFCYLVAETPFGPFENPNTRLILIGGDHKTQARLFVTPESLQRTEVFEYAKALGNSQYTLTAFQVYKFIYASMLADMGLLQQASNYYQSISSIVKDNASSCSTAFLSQLHAFGDRISKIAPASSKASLAPPRWLSGLVQKGLSALIGEENGDTASVQQVEVAPASAAAPSPVSMVSVVSGQTGGLSPAGPTPMMVHPGAMAPAAPVYNLSGQQSFQSHFPTAAARAQSAAPSSHQQQPEEEEDLMREAFSKPTPSLSAERSAASSTERVSAPSTVSMNKTATKEEAKEKNDDANTGLWGRLGGLFRKKSGKEMRLGQEENEFVYNEELGVWHEKGKPPSQNQRDTIAPPPILSRSSSAPMSAPGSAPFPNSGPLPGSAPPPSGGNQFTRFSSPARGRYVDTFNTNPTVAPTSTPTVSLPSPSPLGVGQSTNPPAFNVFTPPGTPSNPQASSSFPQY